MKVDTMPGSATTVFDVHNIAFDPVSETDVAALTAVFNYYVQYTTVSMHIELLTEREMRELLFSGHPLFAAYTIRHAGRIIGYCSLSPWEKQEAYRFTAAIDIYLEKELRGKGIGVLALQFLEQKAQVRNICHLLAGVCGENYPCISLLRKAGYTRCAHFSKIGWKFQRSLDMQCFQKSLSPLAG
jgi:phosphinothricin acetyltransferase